MCLKALKKTEMTPYDCCFATAGATFCVHLRPGVKKMAIKYSDTFLNNKLFALPLHSILIYYERKQCLQYSN